MDAPDAVTDCRVCHAPAGAPYALCFCCDVLVRQLGLPLVPVATVTDYRMGDAMHRRLRGYKDAPVAEARASYVRQLASLLDAWVADGSDRLADGRWDVVATVPSSRRPAGAPVEAVVGAVAALASRHRPLLVRGPQPTGHLRAARRGFALAPGVDRAGLSGQRVLLVDDCVVTGARGQSAAAALRLAGARVVAVVAIGRRGPARTSPVGGGGP